MSIEIQPNTNNTHKVGPFILPGSPVPALPGSYLTLSKEPAAPVFNFKAISLADSFITDKLPGDMFVLPYRISGFKDLIFILQSALEKAGIPGNTINTGCKNFNNNKQVGWPNFGRGKDRYILINCISTQTLKQYNISTADFIAHFHALNNAEAAIQIQNHETETQKREKECLARLTAATDSFLACYDIYKDIQNHAKQAEYLKKHAGAKAIIEATDKGSHKSKIYEFFAAWQSLFPGHIDNENYFYQFIKKCRQNGIRETLLHKSTGQARHKKANDFHIYFTELYAADPHKYSYRTIAELVNCHCKDSGQPLISVSWVKTHMAKPETQNALSLYRNGEGSFTNTVRPFTPRIEPQYAGDLYLMDGSPAQIFGLDANGKARRYNVYIILDGHSRKVVGFDIAESEERFSVLNALQMAFKLHGYLPFEILHDNFSAAKTDEFTSVKNILQTKGVSFRPSRVGNARDKAFVERFFGSFQTVFCKLIDEYIGEGIRSKRENGRPSPEFLKQVTSAKGIMPKNELIARVSELIAIYNKTALNDKPCPADLHTQSEKPNAKEIRPEDIALLFWKNTQITVRNSMIRLIVRKQQYFYTIYDNDLKLRYNGQEVKVYFDETDLNRIQLFDLHTGAYICECRHVLDVYSANANQTPETALNIIKSEAHNNSLKTHIKARTALKAEAANKIVPLTDIELISPYAAAKETINDAESQAMLNMIYDRNNIDPDSIPDYVPMPIKNDYTEALAEAAPALNHNNLYTPKKLEFKELD